MKIIDLNGEWQFRAVGSEDVHPTGQGDVSGWMSARVPGTVHTDLLACGKIPDPFHGLNENDVQWVGRREWLYHREFDVDESFARQNRVELVAEGLDTFATIKINGRNAGSSSDMFVEHRFDVKKYLRTGKNEIEILFDSADLRAIELEKKHKALMVGHEPHRIYARKAQYSFGWDWGPRLVTAGIWRGIRIEGCGAGRLSTPFAKVVALSKKEAVVELSVDVELLTKEPMVLKAEISHNGVVAQNEERARSGRKKFRFRIRKPEIWWPNGYGGQPLYRAVLTLFSDGDAGEREEFTFALRTVRLLQRPDDEGRSFTFEINGEKIYCKGADWIPSDSFIPRIADGTYERLLGMAKDANMNMLRVWGGGIYEQDIFYNLCDRLGLMVWQDFMFACAEYPEHPWFLKQVRDEAKKAVERLRNHPSIVLWCGNNECEWIFCQQNPEKSPDAMSGATIFRSLLPAVCRKLDGTRPYWRSSPFGSGFPNDESNGNHHQWEMWARWRDFKEYESDHARFVTEFGFQAPPHLRTLETIGAHPDDHPLTRLLEHHNKLPEGTERIYRFQAGHLPVATDLEDFVYKGQIIQAEALKTAVEHWRRRKFRTSGSLFWQLNDCWPVTSWSVVDSALRPKAAYYYAKKFCAPVLVSFRGTRNETEVWGTSDLLTSFNGLLEVELRTFDGTVHWRRGAGVRVNRNGSVVLMRVRSSEWAEADLERSYLLARLKSDGQTISENRRYFVEPKHMRLSPSEVNLTVASDGSNGSLVTLICSGLKKNLRLEIENEDAGFDDNYFDLDARIPKVVRVSSKLPDNLIKEMLRLRSL